MSWLVQSGDGVMMAASNRITTNAYFRNLRIKLAL